MRRHSEETKKKMLESWARNRTEKYFEKARNKSYERGFNKYWNKCLVNNILPNNDEAFIQGIREILEEDKFNTEWNSFCPGPF